MSYWPDDILTVEYLSPAEIMRDAGAELEGHRIDLKVSIDQTRLDDRVVLAFNVSRPEIDTTINLFEVSHLPDQAYPAVIDPPKLNIPEFLKKERFIPGKPGHVMHEIRKAMLEGTPGRTVKNEWVCATPGEFQSKLKELLSQDSVKSLIVSLLAPIGPENGDQDEARETDQDKQG